MIWVPVVIGLAVGGMMILAASRWAASSPPPAPPARPAPATDKQRAYLRVLLAERDDAGKFIASDDPGLSKLAASKLIRRLLREREQRRRKPEVSLCGHPPGCCENCCPAVPHSTGLGTGCYWCEPEEIAAIPHCDHGVPGGCNDCRQGWRSRADALRTQFPPG